MKKTVIFLLIITVFTFFAPAMKAMRHVLVSVIYAGSDDDDSTKYEEYDDESEDMSCCGESAPEETSPATTSYDYQEDTSSDDMSCGSTDDVDGDRNDSPTNNTECTYGSYKCDGGVAYSCNRVGYWVYLQNCNLYSKQCKLSPICGTDSYGKIVPYCCQ